MSLIQKQTLFTLFVSVFSLTFFAYVGVDEYKYQQSLKKPIIKTVMKPKYVRVNHVDNFWERMHEIESASGRIKYQGNDKDCLTTNRFCGHFQIGYEALKDIGCTTKKCKADRDHYDKSLNLAKRILAKKLERYSVSENWKKYALYQQGAKGLKTVTRASRGEIKLSKAQLKRMARNSMYSYQELKRLGSKKAAKAFLYEWRSRWEEAGKRIANI